MRPTDLVALAIWAALVLVTWGLALMLERRSA
jgi:hypothetical protein